MSGYNYKSVKLRSSNPVTHNLDRNHTDVIVLLLLTE